MTVFQVGRAPAIILAALFLPQLLPLPLPLPLLPPFPLAGQWTATCRLRPFRSRIYRPCLTSPVIPLIANQSTTPSFPQAASTSALTGSSLSSSNTNVRRPNSPALPSLDSVFRLRVSTLHHVPKVARDAWGHVFGEAVQAIVLDPSKEEVWVKFFMLAKCILTNPPRGGRCHWRDTQKCVQARIAKWRAGEFMYLWESVVEDTTQLNRRLQKRRFKTPPSDESVRSANARRARRAVVVNTGKLFNLSRQTASLRPQVKCWMRCYRSTLNLVLHQSLLILSHPQSKLSVLT